MNQTQYSIDRENFRAFLSKLSKEADVYIPVKKDNHLYYKRYDPAFKGEYTAEEIRPTEPIKSFFTCSREKVDKLPTSHRKQVLVGVKNCDLTSLAIQDFVFKKSDPPDPFYVKKRENTIIISCDCSALRETCFCTALNIDPYPAKGFDLNLTKIPDGFIVESGSKDGDEMIISSKNLFFKASESQIDQKAENRKSFKDSLSAQTCKAQIPNKESIDGSIKKSFGAVDMWNEFASTCIECGGCNHCCPTCHCFFLSDQSKGTLKARYKSWDACLYNRFAKVAGGASPRRHLYERLRNRFDKKFEFFPNVLNMIACTGCGRCIETCPGKIDIREVLKKMSK